jgi:hypothetical protein
VEGQTLSASSGTWSGSPTSFAYQWEDCSTAGEACANIGGATSSSYKLASGDVGHTLRVVVTASNAGGSTKASSAATGTVVPPPPANTALPSVSGSAVEGQSLAASSGTWSGSPTSFAYQWQDCNTSGGACVDISGATSSSYELRSGDVGHALRVVVTASNPGGSTKASSAATGTVVPLPPTNTVPPSVTGSAVEGQTLSASSGTWSGSPTSLAYQWEDCNTSGESCSNISGATSSGYKLAAGDVGHTLRVAVTATNAGGATTVSSAATTAVVPLAPANTARPSVSGAAVEGETLSASTGTWSGSPTSFAYQWEDCNTAGEACANIGGATSSGYKLASGDVAHTLRVVVTASNAGGSAKASSAATGTVVPPAPANTVLPSVSGSAVEGQTLSASSGTWSGSPTSFAYQWEDCNTAGEACANIGGATSSGYKLASGDVGHTLRVAVTASNAGGSAKASSAATGTIVPPAPANTVLPSVSGSAVEGQTLSASSGTWSGSPTSFAYQWEDCNTAGEACANIGGATSSNYKLASGDVGHTLRVVVTASNAGGSAKASSTATETVVPLPPANTALPSVSGSAVEGQSLGASSGTWSGSPTSFAYQWQDCNTSGEACSNIGGATSLTYKLTAGDVGSTVRVVVTASNAGGSTQASATATAVVTSALPPANTALPSVNGSAVEGQTLSASTGTWSGSPTSFAYQWEDCNTAGEACSNIGGATSSNYKLVAGDVGHTLRVAVTATNPNGSTKASSTATAPVTPLPPANTALPSVSGSTVEGQTLSASAGTWSGSPSSFAYRWQDCDGSGEACSNIAGATSSSYTLQATDVEHTLRVVVTASNAGGSTQASSAATATVTANSPPPPPAAPTNIVAPSVSGATVEGETLTASNGTWTESPSSYTYQWQDCDPLGEGCLDVSGATSSTYRLTAGDVGSTVRVLVTASNAGGSTQAGSAATTTVTSAPPPPSPPTNTALPSVSGSAVEGQTLSASTGTWLGSPTSYAYQWEDCNTAGEVCANIGGATSSSYQLVSGDVGRTVRVVVTASNAGGSTPASSAATGTVVPPAPANTALPSVSGAAEEGQTLTASQGTWTNAPTSYAYQWEDCSTAGEACANIGGATSSSYELASGDVGHTVRVAVTASNAGGSTKASSTATGTVVTPAPANTALPAVGGVAEEGQTLSASQGTWTNAPTSYAYQWEDCSTAGEACANIGGATSSSYKLASGDVGHTLRVAVTASNAGGSTKASSAATGTVVPPAPANTSLPSVSGSAVEGQTLSASTGTWSGSPTSYAYQWEDCSMAGEACANIGGATSSSYKLVSGDVGHTLRVAVTASNAGGSTPATSAATGTVVPPAPTNTVQPSVSGSAVEGQTLSASTGTWLGSPTSYAYQWEDCNTAGEACANIGGATSSSYKLASGDVGHTVRVVVTASNAGGSTPASSAATGTVVPPAPANTALPSVSGVTEEGQTLSASQGTWTNAPTSYAYQWEDCNTAGEACANIGGATSSSYKLASGDVGHTVRVAVTASNAGGSAKASSAATGTVVPPAPANTVLPSVSGSAVEGQTLSASTGTWSGSPTSYAYQWEDCNTAGEACANIGGATASSYKLASGDVGHTLRVVVTASNAGGSTKASSAASGTVAPPAPVNTALPSVTGSAVEGQTLAASSGTWSGSPTSFAYQWEDCNTAGEACSNIGGATSSSYKLAASDVGHTVRVLVTASNAGGSMGASSTATGTVLPLAPANTALPSVSGVAEEGQTLTASKGTWTNNPTSYAYQWEDCNTAGESCSNIGGATSSSYELVSGDVGHTLRVAVTATNAGGSTKASSAASATVVAASVGGGSQIYVAQNGAGSQNGEGSCSNAHPLSWLNRESDWGSDAGKVAPGTTVDLCGTFSEPVETKGNGSSGKPVTILFTAGAKIAKGGAGCPGSGCLNIANESAYITIDGGSDGVIENTDSGTGKESPSTTTGIQANGCKHCAIENLEIANLYVAKKGDEKDNTEIRGIFIREGSPEYVTVSHDVFHDMGWAVNIEASESTSHIYVEHDTFYHLTHGFTPTAAFNGGNIGPVVFAHNHWYGNLNWEDGNPSNGTGPDTNHSDGVHCYSADGRGYTPHYNGLYIYDNYVEMEGEDNTAPIFLEGGSGDGSTPCADKTSNIWVYDNVFSSTDTELGDGLLGAYSGEPHIYNNTLIGSGEGACEVLNDHVSAEMRYKDNVITSCKYLIEAEKERFAPNGLEYNLYANGGSEPFVCLNPNKHEYGMANFGKWQECMEDDKHSITASSAKLDLQEAVGAQGKPEAGSPALDAGANLTSLCPSTPEEALCKNINGEARPSTGAWNIGAY